MPRESADELPIPETELQMARRHLVDAEGLVARQVAIVDKLEHSGSPIIMLGREVLANMRKITAVAKAHLERLEIKPPKV
jgi:hypothetical protein